VDLPLEALDFGDEDVAAAAHCLDHRRLFQVVFEFTPKPADLDVDRAIEWPGLTIAREMEQLVPGQHLIGVVDKRREQIEFAGCEPDFFTRGENSSRLERSKVQPANRAFDWGGVRFSVVRGEVRRNTLLTRAKSSRGRNGFGR
jgi:hypothetical protein